MFGGQEFKCDMYYGTQEAFEILGFEVIRQNADPTPLSVWLPESLLLPLGVDYDCTMLTPDDDYWLPVCGVIKDFQKGLPGIGVLPSYAVVPWITSMDGQEDFHLLRQLVVQVSGDENEAVRQIAEFYSERNSDKEIAVILRKGG